MVRIPQIADLGTAIRIYYEKQFLSNADILEIFGGKHSSATIKRLKDLAMEKMLADNICVWNARMVDTETAFKAWGLDIASMERRYSKLKKFGFVGCGAVSERGD